jgi:hypothetical protein
MAKANSRTRKETSEVSRSQIEQTIEIAYGGMRDYGTRKTTSVFGVRALFKQSETLRTRYPFILMKCRECARLGAEHEILERHHALAIQTIYHRMGSTDKAEYLRLRATVDKARTDCEVARGNLEWHREHCSRAGN